MSIDFHFCRASVGARPTLVIRFIFKFVVVNVKLTIVNDNKKQLFEIKSNLIGTNRKLVVDF